MKFFVPGVAVTQGSMRHVGRGRMVHSNANLSAWREQVRSVALLSEPVVMDNQQPVGVELTFTLPRPKTVKRLFPTAKHDVDKLVRAVLDALTGVCWVDDGQVVDLRASKRYGEPVGVEVVISCDQYLGVGC